MACLSFEALLLIIDALNTNQVGHHLSGLRICQRRTDAHRCVSVFLSMQQLQDSVEAEAWRLLHLLFLWIGEMSAQAIRAASR
jgi:hypothetical protein